MANEYIMLSMDDEKATKIAEIVGNKTCKKILTVLAEKEASESDIASSLGIPVNTAEYNIKKLSEAGLIEKSSHWWSVKGKKIPVYKIANKYIVIAPKGKSIAKNFLPVALVCGIAAIGIRFLFQSANSSVEMSKDAFEAAPALASGAANIVSHSLSWVDKVSMFPTWSWFLIGALFAMVIVLIFERRKK